MQQTPTKKEAHRIKQLSADENAKRLAFVRERALHDEASLIYDAKQEGREEGREEGELKAKEAMAKSLIALAVLTDEKIVTVTGLPPETVQALRCEELISSLLILKIQFKLTNNLFTKNGAVIKKIYYLHGDKVNENEYYCKICDLKYPSEHFNEEDHIDRNLEAYKKSKIGFKTLKENSQKYDRKIDTYNLFSNKKEETKNKSHFYSWLEKQTDRDDTTGDIARDAIADKKFPSHTSSIKKIVTYLLSKGVSECVIEATKEAHIEFSKR